MKRSFAVVEVVNGVSPIVDALRGQMCSLRDMVETLSEHTFRATPSDSSGSVGEHVRHCLDHVRALTSAVHANEISYDSRLRGTPVETDPLAAIDEIDRLTQALDDLDDVQLARTLNLRTLPARTSAPVRVRTTIERETAFVVQHTIHHCATMAVLLERLRVAVPNDFGYAPSTPVPRLQSNARA